MDDLPVFKDKPEKVDGEWRMVGRLQGNKGRAIGIDPGVNYGMTVIEGPEVYVYWGKLAKESRTGFRGILAYNYIQKTVPARLAVYKKTPAVVEGAAYWMPKGQVGLEEIRFGFFLSLYHKGYMVAILPPAAIRKIAFGNGRMMAGDIWPDSNQNGLDSVGCALAALRSQDA